MRSQWFPRRRQRPLGRHVSAAQLTVAADEHLAPLDVSPLKPDTFDGLTMGYEYMLDFEVVERSEADRVLRSVAGFETFDPKLELYYFRRTAAGAMPDAKAAIQTAGIYVCDNGGAYQVVRDIQAAFAAIGLQAEPREL
jgi:hypothetical protein